MGLAFVLAVLIALLVIAGLGYAVGRTHAPREVPQPHVDVADLQRRYAEARACLEDLKGLAWDHREIDPALSTIIIDEIRSYERRELG